MPPVVAGDFNGDGLLDLAVASVPNDRPGGLSILLGTGGGNFFAPLAFPLSSRPALPSGVVAASGAYFLALGDFNNDGKTDAVALTASPTVGGAIDFVPGQGDGTLGSPVQTVVGGAVRLTLYQPSAHPFAPPTSTRMGTWTL